MPIAALCLYNIQHENLGFEKSLCGLLFVLGFNSSNLRGLKFIICFNIGSLEKIKVCINLSALCWGERL